jgi:photosystem II stability/assembly factor-like uncharacterized protein
MDRISRTIQRFLPLAAASAALTFGSGVASAQTPTTVAPPPVSVGHSGWYWGSPTPQGQFLLSVAFDGTTGYAVGWLGTVLRSEDGGQSWTGMPSGTIANLDLVQEIDPETVIAGGQCSVLESTNGGQSFKALPIGLAGRCTDPVAGLSFSNAQQGYMVLKDGTLLYTADGGVTVQARSSVPTGGGFATGLAFSSPTTGLATTSTGMIELTTDGGNSWSQVFGGQALAGITIVSPTLIYAVGGQGELVRSTDGGQTWTVLPLALSGGAVRPDLTSISCSSGDDCLITTDGSAGLVRTTDGGMTGALVSVSENAVTGVAFTTGAGVVGVGGQGATFLSADGGQTFPIVSAAGVSGGFGGTELIAGRAPGTAYLAGGQGTIAATTDEGAGWTKLRVPTNAAIVSTAFASASVGYALDAKGTLRRTTDGGTSWSSFAATYSPRSQLVVPSAQTVLLVGPRGIRRSSDGGATFTAVAGRVRLRHGAGPAVRSLRLIGARTNGRIAWAWGPSGLVVSSDSGRIWRRIPLRFAGGKIQTVSVVSPTRAWVDTLNARLYETTDGGRRWTRNLAIGGLGEPAIVSFGSSSDGIVALSGSRQPLPFTDASVLSTHDGGRTWEPQIVDGETPFDALATPSADYLVGDYSLPVSLGFFATTNGGASPLASSLTISVARRTLTAAALKRAGHSLLVRGRLRPVLSNDENVLVSYTTAKGWRTAMALVATNGAFQARLHGIRASTEIVAQALGDGRHGGAGTPVLRVTVRH